MDGFRLVKLNEVIRQVDIVITCTGMVVVRPVGWDVGMLPWHIYGVIKNILDKAKLLN
jgi:hypothetical protein